MFKRISDSTSSFLSDSSLFYSLLAASIHSIWGGLLLVSPEVGGITPLAVMTALPAESWVDGSILLIASFLAFYSVYRDRALHTLSGFVALLPQQFLLLSGAWGEILAVISGQYAGGYEASRYFILADQTPMLLLAAFHTMALVNYWKRLGWK